MAYDYWPCYNSYFRKCEKLSDQELGRLFRALLTYSCTGERQDLTGRESIAFDFIADDIDRAKENYESRCRQNSENGAKGGRPPKAKKAVGFLKSEKSQSKSESEYKSEIKETSPNGEGKKTHFVPPTLEEVTAYVAERGSPVEPQGFIDFYAAKGWLVGKTPMKDWKAACRNAEHWERWGRVEAPKGKTACSDYADPGVVAMMRKDLDDLARFAEEGT